MPGKQDGYMRQIDGLRFFAVSAVLFGHWTLHFSSLKAIDLFLGGAGVNLFFVISGFLISQILILQNNQGISRRSIFTKFYIRRFLRIFPLYYLVLFLAVVAAVPNARGFFIWLFTYTSNYPTALTHFSLGYMSHLWSLSVEEQFYIIFPFLLLFVKKEKHIRMFLLLIILSVAFRAFAFVLSTDKTTGLLISYVFTASCFDCFAIGAFLAYLRVNNPGRLSQLLKKDCLFLLVGLCSVLIFSTTMLWRDSVLSVMLVRLAFAVFCFWLVGNAADGRFAGFWGKLLNAKSVVYLGRISYGLYMYHFFMEYIFNKIGFAHNPVLYAISTIAVSAVSYHFFELPVNNLKSRFSYSTLPVNFSGKKKFE